MNKTAAPRHVWRKYPPTRVVVYSEGGDGRLVKTDTTLPEREACKHCGVSRRAATAFGWQDCQPSSTARQREEE